MLKDVSLQYSKSCVSAAGSGSRVLFLIDAISLRTGNFQFNTPSCAKLYSMENVSCIIQEICPWILVNVVTTQKGELFDLVFGLGRFFIGNYIYTTFCMSIYHVEDLRGFKKIRQIAAWWVSYR